MTFESPRAQFWRFFLLPGGGSGASKCSSPVWPGAQARGWRELAGRAGECSDRRPVPVLAGDSAANATTISWLFSAVGLAAQRTAGLDDDTGGAEAILRLETAAEMAAMEEAGLSEIARVRDHEHRVIDQGACARPVPEGAGTQSIVDHHMGLMSFLLPFHCDWTHPACT